VVICLERGADLHVVQLMPLPLTVSCFSKIQIGFYLSGTGYPGSPGQRAVKRVCVIDLGPVASCSVSFDCRLTNPSSISLAEVSHDMPLS